jgi:hypothetical protein
MPGDLELHQFFPKLLPLFYMGKSPVKGTLGRAYEKG